MRPHLKLLLGLLVSIVAVYLSLKKIDFGALGASLRAMAFFFLLPAVLAQLSCFILKGAAWRFLLMPAKRNIRLASTISILLIGLMVNNLFPAKIGELARGVLMGEREGLPKSLCLSTVALEHLLDILVLLTFLLILIPGTPLPPWLQMGGTLVGFGALGTILFLFWAVRREQKFLGWMDRLLFRLPGRLPEKLRSLLHNFFQGFRVVTGRYLLFALAALFPMWIMSSLFAYCMLAACGLSLPVQAAVMVVIFVAFGKILPSSPGAIGTYHYLVILVLTSMQISKEAALGYAIVLHALAYLVEVSLGLVALFAGNLSLGSVVRGTERSL